MQGQVLGVDTRTGDGVITGEDGQRYRFRPRDWADTGEPAVGMKVDFEVEQNRAVAIFPVPGSVPALHPAALAPNRNDRNKYIAALIAFLLGPFGVHRFYLGRTGSGIAMLILSCTIIGLIISVPWAFIDTIRYLVMPDREFDARYTRD